MGVREIVDGIGRQGLSWIVLGAGRRASGRGRCLDSRLIDEHRRFGRAALSAHAAADEYPAEEDHDRHNGRGHEQEDQLFAVELDFVEAVVSSLRRQAGCDCTTGQRYFDRSSTRCAP